MAGRVEDGYNSVDKEKGGRKEDGEIPRSNGGHAVRDGVTKKVREGNRGKEYVARGAGGF